MSGLHWTAQFLLAGAFLFAGFTKLFAYDKLVKTLERRSGRKDIFVSRRQAAVIGILEVVSALALLVPSTMLPISLASDYSLVRCAAAGLALLMVAAGTYHWLRKEPAALEVSLFLLAVLVIFNRWPE